MTYVPVKVALLCCGEFDTGFGNRSWDTISVGCVSGGLGGGVMSSAERHRGVVR